MSPQMLLLEGQLVYSEGLHYNRVSISDVLKINNLPQSFKYLRVRLH